MYDLVWDDKLQVNAWHKGVFELVKYEKLLKNGYIIVEGLKGIGKSTYCREMSNHTNYYYIEIQRARDLILTVRYKALKIIRIEEYSL